MYCGVAEPDSPASTSAALPGARCTSRKFSVTITRIVGTACATRRPMKRARSLATPIEDYGPRADGRRSMLCTQRRLVEGRIRAEWAHRQVLELRVVYRHELQLEYPDERCRVDHQLLELVVKRAALGRIDLDRRRLHQLVGFRAAPSGPVDEDGALLDRPGRIEAIDADHRIGKILYPVRRELEAVVGIDAAQPRRHILIANRRLDPDLCERLLDVLAEALPLVPVRRDVVHDLESRAIRLPLVAGFVEHLVGDVGAIRQVVAPDVGGVDAAGRKVGADRTGGRLAEPEPDVVDDELAIDRDRDGPPHPNVVERLHARV